MHIFVDIKAIFPVYNATPILGCKKHEYICEHKAIFPVYNATPIL